MRFLLTLVICIPAICVTFGVGLSLLPGLSLRNLFTFLAAAGLVMQVIFGKPLKVELRAIQICFAVLIGYAFVTMIVAGEVLKYPHYDMLSSAVSLKANLIDWAVNFCVCFYGARSKADAERLVAILLACVSAANLVTLANVVGIVHIGAGAFGDDLIVQERVFGVFGHANETGTLIACLLPAYFAVIASSTGYRKFLWMGGMMASATVLILTSSRGALVGVFVGGIWAAILCRRYLSFQQIMKWGAVCGGAMVVVLVFVGVKYWDQVVGRFTGVSMVSMSDVSSGRSDLWWQGIRIMLETPLAFITGYGWNAWFYLSGLEGAVAHNQYLSIWFELGLVGLISFIAIFWHSVVAALAAARVADFQTRPYMVAFVFGILSLCIALIFGNLFIPWGFIWPYVGLSMRQAVLSYAVKDHPSTAPGQKSPMRPVAPQAIRRRSARAVSNPSGVSRFPPGRKL